jgi:hypothetical protein
LNILNPSDIFVLLEKSFVQIKSQVQNLPLNQARRVRTLEHQGRTPKKVIKKSINFRPRKLAPELELGGGKLK